MHPGMFALLQVTVFSTSEKKEDEALKVLKADHFVVSKNEDAMQVMLSPPCTGAMHYCM